MESETGPTLDSTAIEISIAVREAVAYSGHALPCYNLGHPLSPLIVDVSLPMKTEAAVLAFLKSVALAFELQTKPIDGSLLFWIQDNWYPPLL